MRSAYLGAFTKYRIYNGTGTLDSTKFDFSIPEFTVGINVGKRWVWKSGFNVNVAIGYGIITIGRESDPDNPEINLIIDEFESKYDFLNPLLLEVSIGYSF